MCPLPINRKYIVQKLLNMFANVIIYDMVNREKFSESNMLSDITVRASQLDSSASLLHKLFLCAYSHSFNMLSFEDPNSLFMSIQLGYDHIDKTI